MIKLPRVSISGMLILFTFIMIMQKLFQFSIYSSILRADYGFHYPSVSEPHGLFSLLPPLVVSYLINGCTCAASFINVLSHSAVALGFLNDTYVLAILLGVGFDVATRTLYLVWWTHITCTLTLPVYHKSGKNVMSTEGQGQEHDHDNGVYLTSWFFEQSFIDPTLILLLILATLYIYHMIIHVRALYMNHSRQRVQNVLAGALNNLRGIPGKGYTDHLFEYTDLGIHLLAFILSAKLLQSQDALFVALYLLGMLLIISYIALSRIPLKDEMKNTSNSKLMSMMQLGASIDSRIMCRCGACSKRKRRQTKRGRGDHPVSFTFNKIDGICQLWLCSFEQLSNLLRSAKSC
mmetsp:Transcript_10906/g.16507  ORF Transcript_10906/g.16507 Transcript_10906/m.16507 type:complete len:349 (+) Transcript_10906:152-1198(+)